MHQVIVVVQQPASAFKLELAGFVVDAFCASGVSASMTTDGDDSCLEASSVLLFGDCLGLGRSGELLSGTEAENRPETTLWQIEPLPPTVDEGWTMSAGRAAAARSWETFRRSRGSRLLRSIVPGSLRSPARRIVDRTLARRGREPDPSGYALRNRGAGVRRFARLAWIERAWREGWLDHVATSAPERAALLAARGIEASFVPVGYHPGMGIDTGVERDLDVVFLGRIKKGRAPVLARVAEELGDRGVELTINEGPSFGDDRSHFLNRAKISVNILNDVWELSRTRALLSMACGALVVSEPVSNSAPFVAGEHIVFATPDEMPDVITHWLSSDEARNSVVARSTELLSEALSMPTILRNMAAAWDRNPFGAVH